MLSGGYSYFMKLLRRIGSDAQADRNPKMVAKKKSVPVKLRGQRSVRVKTRQVKARVNYGDKIVYALLIGTFSKSVLMMSDVVTLSASAS